MDQEYVCSKFPIFGIDYMKQETVWGRATHRRAIIDYADYTDDELPVLNHYEDEEVLYRWPFGDVLCKLISVDERRLIQLAESEEYRWQERPYLSLTDLPMLSLDEIAMDESLLTKFACDIAVLREFIDICIDDASFFCLSFFKFLVNQTGWRKMIPSCEFVMGRNKYEFCYIADSVFEDRQYDDPESYASQFQIAAYSTFKKPYDSNSYTSIDIYRFDWFLGCVLLELEEMINQNILIRKCKNCGKYFIPRKRSDAKYCDNPAPQAPDKTCKEYGGRAAWEQTLRENDAAGLYRKIYMARQMAAKRHPDEMEYQEAFEMFKAQSRGWKADVKSGLKTNSEYLAWLEAMK